MSALLALALTALTARAESRADGTSGGLTAPTAEVLPRGKTAFAISANTAISTEGAQFGVLPFGVGYSFGRNTELGFLVDLQGQSLENPTFGGSRLGVRYRRRLSGDKNGTPPLVVEAAVDGFTGGWGADLTAVTGFRLGGWDVHPSLGGAWSESDSFAATGALVVARYLPSGLRLLGELTARGAPDGLESLEGRLGVRLALAKRVHMHVWGGGGLLGAAPWGGGGATVLLYALDPRDLDRDGDTVTDWKDKCPANAEDVDKFEDYDGCPELDNDGDGIPDAKDPTPNGESHTPLQYSESTPLLRMRIHERGLPGDDPDAP